MKNIFALAASNSKKSINKELIRFTATQISESGIDILDLNDLYLPMFSPDLQEESGIPDNAVRFVEMIASCEGIIMSIAEHNGHYSAAFKNLWDWCSRFNRSFWAEKPMLLMSTSPGPGGGGNALSAAQKMLPFFGGNVVADFSLPSFYDNFSEGKLINPQIKDVLTSKIHSFDQALSSLNLTR